MTQWDLFYRAFREYGKILQKDREGASLRDAIVHADESDKITVIRTECRIEEDWVEAIEHGLVFIGKAIDEERQFIRSSGEVEPIEKVKHVSRESVEHLARHSNLISRKPPEGEDLMPEKLYTVERLNNYAVYENRFLYMMLCRLNDFISLRYNRIVRETNTYRGEVLLRKEVTEGKHRLQYEFSMRESREDDPYLRSHNRIGEQLKRLEHMQRTVYYYLHTPLMAEVSKADKLKPPITKTNVLRMDKNFKEVVALYEFLLAYDKEGFTVTKEERSPDPKTERIAREFTEPALLLSFLTYEHGMGIEGELAAEFEREEARRREEERRAVREQLENLRRLIREGGGSPEEYMQLLEKRNRALEKDSEQLLVAQAALKDREAEIRALHEQAEALGEEISSLHAAHAAELEERDAREESLRRKMEEEAVAHAAALVQSDKEKKEEIARLIAENDEAMRESDARYAEKSGEFEMLRREMEALRREDALLKGRFLALRKEHGLLTDADDYTSEQAFEELEFEYEVLGEFLRSEWKGAKKMLRKDFFAALKRSFFDKLHKSKGAATKADGSDGTDAAPEADTAPVAEATEAEKEEAQSGENDVRT